MPPTQWARTRFDRNIIPALLSTHSITNHPSRPTTRNRILKPEVHGDRWGAYQFSTDRVAKNIILNLPVCTHNHRLCVQLFLWAPTCPPVAFTAPRRGFMNTIVIMNPRQPQRWMPWDPTGVYSLAAANPSPTCGPLVRPGPRDGGSPFLDHGWGGG